MKIQLQDATTSTKHVGFRIDKSCQTFVNNSEQHCHSDGVKDNSSECSCIAAANAGQNEELALLKEELKKATQALSEAMAVKPSLDGAIDFGAESPLNLFIQCFKEKYGLVVNPNDVAIFV